MQRCTHLGTAKSTRTHKFDPEDKSMAQTRPRAVFVMAPRCYLPTCTLLPKTCSFRTSPILSCLGSVVEPNRTARAAVVPGDEKAIPTRVVCGWRPAPLSGDFGRFRARDAAATG